MTLRLTLPKKKTPKFGEGRELYHYVSGWVRLLYNIEDYLNLYYFCAYKIREE